MRHSALERPSEKIIFGKPGKTSLGGVVHEIEREGMDGSSPKSVVKGRFRPTISGDELGGRELHLVVKDVGTYFGFGLFGSEQISMSPARRYYERWRFLRSIGVPTVSSMRVIDDCRVAMGDMTIGGAVFFGKEKSINADQEARRDARRELSELERVFLDIGLGKIKEEIVRVQVLAWEKGVRLPADDEYDLLVRLDASFQVLVLDLSQLRKRRDEAGDSLLRERNILFGYLDKMAANLRKVGGVVGKNGKV